MLVLLMEAAAARRRQLPAQSWWGEGDPPGQGGWREEDSPGDVANPGTNGDNDAGAQRCANTSQRSF